MDYTQGSSIEGQGSLATYSFELLTFKGKVSAIEGYELNLLTYKLTLSNQSNTNQKRYTSSVLCSYSLLYIDFV